MMKKVYRLKLNAVAKAKRTEIRSKTGANQFEDMEGWIAFFQENNRLPNQKILCARCKKTATSCFGDNLKRWLGKFGNDISKLLKGFECSPCRKADGPVKATKTKRPKVVNTEAGDITVKGNTAKEYMTVEEMEDRKEKVRATLPKFDPEARPVRIDFKDADAVAELTLGACQRPDIYLDAGCSNCPLVKHCKAHCCVPDRNLEKGERIKRSKGPSRK